MQETTPRETAGGWGLPVGDWSTGTYKERVNPEPENEVLWLRPQLYGCLTGSLGLLGCHGNAYGKAAPAEDFRAQFPHVYKAKYTFRTFLSLGGDSHSSGRARKE